jgi:hypothetical protein
VTTKETDALDRNAEEAALRDVWYTRVLVEQGRRIPIKFDLSTNASARPSSSHS